MIDAGIAIVQALQALATRRPTSHARHHPRCLLARGAGESFSEALTRHPKAFNRLYVSMVSAGEKGGLLAEILGRLAPIWKTPNGSAKK